MGPPKGPKEEILNSQFNNGNATNKSLKKTLKIKENHTIPALFQKKQQQILEKTEREGALP
jgi:hypothetical protein